MGRFSENRQKRLKRKYNIIKKYESVNGSKKRQTASRMESETL
jgi:hypothetical protein